MLCSKLNNEMNKQICIGWPAAGVFSNINSLMKRHKNQSNCVKPSNIDGRLTIREFMP